MLQGWFIALVSFAYLGVLFAIAWYGDRRADAAVPSSPTDHLCIILAVYCTTWTYYGSVGVLSPPASAFCRSILARR